ncbi:glycoside hydrolase family 88 protein [Methylopila sp. 73B]|uniref:glycoside hydrolase family 88 protein n=1 Tax=Methylopila sp. 73B TaxID=1120792 RepID=UPI000367DD4D|nr:glycoside hydrolase family 88 protein [Methylopila sp. 73B]
MSHTDFAAALDLLARKTLADEATIGVSFPYVTGPDGAWRTLPASWSAGYSGADWSHGNWFCGFWVGLLLASYLQTRDERFVEFARTRMQLVAERAGDGNTHDIGFIFLSSAMPLHHILGDEAAATTALKAADRLRRRLIVTHDGAYVSSWGPLSDARGRRASAIDTMANLPLLFWAAQHACDGSFLLAGEAHALKTRDGFIRPDDSTYHAVEYDDVTGERVRGYTFQGYADESCWPRGQGWAIYGFVETARATGKSEHIATAERLLAYYFRRVDDGLVPFWDFDDPAIPNAPRDSSASAIVASALLTLGAIHPDQAAGERWRALGERVLAALCRDYLATDDAHRGLLRHGCYSKPHNDGVDSAVMFGDYFLVEALCLVLHPGAFRPHPDRLAG